MSVEFREFGRVVVFAPTHGVYEGRECDEMEARMTALARSGARIVVDLTHASITAHCVGVLAGAQRIAVEHGGRIALCGAHPTQCRLLQQLGLADVIPVHPDRATALRSMDPALESAA